MTKPTVRIKICGLTRAEDARLAVELGAWALGFIFFKNSPRYINPIDAAKIISQCQDVGQFNTVGVFVNSKLDEIITIVKEAGLTAIQLHGDETPEFCTHAAQFNEQLRGKLHFGVIKAIRSLPNRPVDSDLTMAMNFRTSGVAAILLDAAVPGSFGGTGQLTNWELAEKMASNERSFGNVILSGGINTSNIRAAITKIHPFALDISSSIEDSPGIKNHKKMTELFKMIGV